MTPRTVGLARFVPFMFFFAFMVLSFGFIKPVVAQQQVPVGPESQERPSGWNEIPKLLSRYDLSTRPLLDWQQIRVPSEILIRDLRDTPDLMSLFFEGCPDCETVEGESGTWVLVNPKPMPNLGTWSFDTATADTCSIPAWLRTSSPRLDSMLEQFLSPRDYAEMSSHAAAFAKCERKLYLFRVEILNQALEGGGQ